MEPSTPPILELRGIRKSFPGVLALSQVDFAVHRGTVHVICGENGAGKSTLMKVINGIHKPDKGAILIDGRPAAIENPQHAAALGIAMIFQELNFVPEMTVEENLFLGREILGSFGRLNRKAMRDKTVELLAAEELPYSPQTRLKDLTVSDIQMLEIVKAISRNADIIIMDEPTSAITAREVERLLHKIGELKARGKAIIYISHKMEEIFRIADQITIIRDGEVVDSRPAAQLDIDQVISLMVGRQITNVYPKAEVEPGELIFESEGLTREGVFQDVSFKVRAGEIVGFAGLVGAGRSEVARAIFGLDPLDGGAMRLKGQPLVINNVRQAIQAGLAMLSEDRRRYGLVSVRSIRENASLATIDRFAGLWRVKAGAEQKAVYNICEQLRVKASSFEAAVDTLSGGNQQKVVLAKWLLAAPDLLFLDEPTRGIDVGAKYEIYKLMVDIAAQKKGVVMISSELPELLGMCDRIYVMAKGRIQGELARPDFSQENIMRLATGGLN